MVGGDRLLQMRRPALPLSELPERVGQVRLGRRPLERYPMARPFGERRAEGLRGVSEGAVIASLLANRKQCEAERILEGRGLGCTKTGRGLQQVTKTYRHRLKNSYEVSAAFFRCWSDGG